MSSRHSWTKEEQNILRTVLYFDLFRHPLSFTELLRFIPSSQTNGIRSLIEQGPLSEVLTIEQEHVRLRSRPATLLEERAYKEVRARRYWHIARVITSLLRNVPFVRCVCISGELSKGVASASSDIDLFIITAAHRVWITRALLTVIKKVMFFNSKRFLCLNHFVSEDHLVFADRNMYTAVEIMTLQPLFGETLHRKYLEANSWVREYAPNAFQEWRDLSAPNESRSFLQRSLEFLLPRTVGDMLEERLFRMWSRMWRRRYANLSPESLDHQFQSSRFISTAYGEDMLARVMARYRELLHEYDCSDHEQSSAYGRRPTTVPGSWPTYS